MRLAVNPLNILFSKLKEIDALAYFRDWLGRYPAGAGGPGESGAKCNIRPSQQPGPGRALRVSDNCTLQPGLRSAANKTDIRDASEFNHLYSLYSDELWIILSFPFPQISRKVTLSNDPLFRLHCYMLIVY